MLFRSDETRSSQISEAANVPGVATPAVPQEHIDTAQAALDTISQAPKLPSATPAPLIRAAKNLGVSVTNMPVAQAIDTVQTRLNELQPQGVSNAPTALTELGRPATGTTGAMGSSGVGSGVGYTAEPAVVERPPVEPAGSNVSDAVRRTGEPNAALELPTTDSTGKDIHPTSEGIKNFWNWFGDSKAVDDAGKPLVVYHGTDPNSEEGFSQFKEGVNYFTPRSDYSYVKNGKYVYPAYVNIKNPYRPANQSEIEQIRNNPERVEELKKAGYDSMLWSQPNNIMRGASGWGNDFPQIVTFYPNQVKSATGNTGEFNQGKPDITASKVEPISNEAVPDEEFTPDQTREEFAGKLGIANAGNYIQQPRSEKLKQAYSWLKGQAFVGKNKKRNVYRDISMGHALNALSTSTNPFIKHIAEQARDKLKHIGFDFNKILKHPRAGVYSRYPGENGFRVPGRETITLHGEHTNDEHTLAHEVIHGFTATAIDYPTEAQKPTIQKLNKLYNTVKDHPLIRGRYGATDVHEFVAEGMSNPEFQYRLSQIKYENTTAWGKFTQLIADLLGVKRDTALMELIANTEQLMDTFETNRAAHKPEAPTKAGRPPKITKPKTPKPPVAEQPPAPPTTPEGPEIEAEPPEKQLVPIAKSIPERIVDYITTMRHSYDAALQNSIERSMRKMGMPIAHIRTVLAASDMSQTVHSAYLAMQGVIMGKLRYNSSKYLWEAEEGPNIDQIKGEVERIGKQYGLDGKGAMARFQEMMVARRIKEIHEAANHVLDTYNAMLATNPKEAKEYLNNHQKIVKLSRTMENLQMTEEEADSVLDEITNDMPEMIAEDGPIKSWNEIRKNTIQTLVDSGRYSRIDAELLLDSAAYVPFQRIMDDQSDVDSFLSNIQQGKAHSLTGNRKIYGIKGSAREVKNVFENMASWQAYSLTMAIKNHKALQLVDSAQMYLPDG